MSFIPSLAVAGSLVLEWYKLSEHTGNNTYRIVAEKAMRRIGMLVCSNQLINVMHKTGPDPIYAAITIARTSSAIG